MPEVRVDSKKLRRAKSGEVTLPVPSKDDKNADGKTLIKDPLCYPLTEKAQVCKDRPDVRDDREEEQEELEEEIDAV